MSRLRWPDSTNSVSEKPGTIQSYAFPLPSSSCKLAQPRCHRSRGRTNTDRLPDQQRMAQAPLDDLPLNPK